jgi:transposase
MIEHEQQRLQNWRLKLLREGEGTRQVAPTCRRYGISHKTFYKWKKRYQEQGPAGLRDLSHKTHTSPRATHPEIVAKILHLRQHYHLGPWRISQYLLRYHDISIPDKTVYQVLRRHGLSRLPHTQAFLPRKQRWRRYEKPLPGHRLQIDTKFLEPIPGKRKSYWQFTAMDDCTRLRVLKIYARNNQKNAIDFVDDVLSRMCSLACPFGCKPSRPTGHPVGGAVNSTLSSTGMCKIKASLTSLSSPGHLVSTAR